MSELEDAVGRIGSWLQPLGDASAPCGPDLEYDNDFLALTQAAAGKPESQFGPAEPPDWRSVRELAESLLERSRDLRLAIFWLRALVRLQGYTALVPGLELLNGLLESMWEQVHPLPDPEDGDPYARVNALAVLPAGEGLLGDLRESFVVQDRAVGLVTGRAVELAADLAEPVGDEAVLPRESLRQMVADAAQRAPALGVALGAAAERLQRLVALADERLGSAAPDFARLVALVRAVAALAPDAQAAEEVGDAAGAGAEAAESGRRGLSGAVTTRDDALRAIDMVCAYLERHEPTNPAPLFLRRARHLVNHNFLQLMKELAPDALPEVARIVGVDPESVETPPRP